MDFSSDDDEEDMEDFDATGAERLAAAPSQRGKRPPGQLFGTDTLDSYEHNLFLWRIFYLLTLVTWSCYFYTDNHGKCSLKQQSMP